MEDFRDRIKHVESIPAEEARKYHNEYQKENQRRNYIGTVIGGRHIMLRIPNKRDWPGHCELCLREGVKLDYHHWDSSNPSKGLWLCYKHHMFAEAVDKGLADEYLKLKGNVEEEFGLKAIAGPSSLDIVSSWALKKEA